MLTSIVALEEEENKLNQLEIDAFNYIESKGYNKLYIGDQRKLMIKIWGLEGSKINYYIWIKNIINLIERKIDINNKECYIEIIMNKELRK